MKLRDLLDNIEDLPPDFELYCDADGVERPISYVSVDRNHREIIFRE